ncbi:ABC transporter permease [Jeotgalibacillus sp. R-1-5s-1]|uniref:ABC transporter permease n=1 Tax=Jeotgalibacillus sp. R-1-5s-1 TaxID=2555897 RepID=UPI00106A2423|nr:ABC transporter permease [Jeotgalibacillus sp. R-1-5s-1]TFD94518.1 ABC transporter permease [Jeotgalibacillus sp. R-1-5s-1]
MTGRLNGFSYLSFKALYSFHSVRLFFFFRLIDPMLHYVFIAAIASALVGSGYLSYIIIGNIAFYAAQIMIINFITMFRMERRFGTLELNIAAPMNTFVVIFRKSIVPLADGLFVFLFGLLIGQLLFKVNIPWDELGNLLLIVLVVTFSVLSLSLFFACLSLLFSNINLFLNLVLGGLQILCGVHFSAHLLPAWIESISRILPLTHGIEALRTLYGLEAYNVQSLLMKEALIGLGYLTVAILIVKVMEYAARRSGALVKSA